MKEFLKDYRTPEVDIVKIENDVICDSNPDEVDKNKPIEVDGEWWG